MAFALAAGAPAQLHGTAVAQSEQSELRPRRGPNPASSARAAAPAPLRPYRVALVVDTGTEVKRICVRFGEPSLTGIEVLQRADVDPVLRSYGGKGAAVCALCGTGCPADGSCLTCGGNRSWVYGRATAGERAFSKSPVGASSTKVRDGDVESWSWSAGALPPFATFAEVCDGAPPTPRDPAAAPARAARAKDEPGDPDNGGSAASVGAFVAVLGALVMAWLVLRRRRA